MSGGGNKKKVTKTQGWEEAGSEFYQETYPTDTEFDVLQKDAKPLATLLPSKQTRAVVTTMRFRTNDSRTMRRYTTTRSRRESTVHRRTLTIGGGDVQVSMLPDLSENLSTEETTWDEIMLIKAMPVPMAQKKEMKAKILNEPNLRLQGYEQFKWKRRKILRQIQICLRETVLKLELWKNDLKQIEGYYGTGVVSYFLFLKWLFYLNLFIFSIIFLFITLPTLLINDNNNLNNTYCIETSSLYDTDIGTILLNLMQGTGFMECSILFYGYYTNKTLTYLNSNNDEVYYNLPLAYILITLIYFIISLIAIVKSAVKGFKERLIEGEGQFYQYCNLIFGSWDFCINNEKTAKIKQKAIYNEIKASLETERFEELRQNRTKTERFKLFLKRFFINLFVIILLICCGLAIYFIYVFSTNKLQQNNINNGECRQGIEQLFYQYLPSILIVCFNITIPFVFRYLITFEKYRPLYAVRLTLLRTVLLRLSSLFVLYATFNHTVQNNKNLYQCNNNVICWETYVGQQIYKLVLTDFFTHVFLVFFVNFPRSLLNRYFNNVKFIRIIGEQTFHLPKHVLDVIYLQTLCWLGCFFSPLLSFIFFLIFLLMFPLKRFQCLINSKPSIIIYRVSRSNSMFMIILLVSFIFALLPITYTITEVHPSINCGPFRNLNTIWSYIVYLFYQTPIWLQDFIFFLSTPGFAIPVIILLILFLYYYKAINSANRHMVNVLKNQLILEGHDKQFLLERLSKFIKQQENQKRSTHVEMMQHQHQHQQQPDSDTNIS